VQADQVEQVSASRHWASIAERGGLWGLKIMLASYGVGRGWLFRPLTALVVAYFALTSSQARRSSYEYLMRVWTFSGHDCGLPRRPTRWTSFRHLSRFSHAVVDKLAAWRGDISMADIDHANRELFESRYQSGEGGVWITSHLGNMEVCRALGQQHLNLKMTVLVHTKHARNFNRVLAEASPDTNLELLQVSDFDIGTAMLLKERVSRGQFVVIVADRTPVSGEGRIIKRDFLGRKANFPVGPFILATVLDCPVGTIFCVREGKRFKMFIDDLPGLQGVRRNQRRLAIEHAVGIYASRLQALCVRYPLEWFNFFPFWDQPGVEQWPQKLAGKQQQ
jgi:predicted LPLAT superfamily acyltransferase